MLEGTKRRDSVAAAHLLRCTRLLEAAPGADRACCGGAGLTTQVLAPSTLSSRRLVAPSTLPSQVGGLPPFQQQHCPSSLGYTLVESNRVESSLLVASEQRRWLHSAASPASLPLGH